ncbi:MAG: D-glycero-beta-D-manno-heptose-7-phosphate kinase [Flammeovirgaceae bacterium]|nr:D-glycero-beta-D-manno-heptose-7-phosphate kinase [Flammeovirgaceae bacterium]
MLHKTLVDVFTAFKKLKVLVIGDVMLDSYIYGDVDRISPEAPVPVLNVKSRNQRLGGAANVALNIQSLGAIPILCSVIGEDSSGNELLDLMTSSGLLIEGIISSTHRQTTRKNRVISGGHHLLRIDEEEDIPLNEEDLKLLKISVLGVIKDCDAIIMEDYDKGCLDPMLIAEIIDEAQRLKIPVAVDPKKRNFLHFKGASLFKPNLKELNEGLKVQINPSQQRAIHEAIVLLDKQLGCENYLITLSEYGVFASKGKEFVGHSAHLRSIADVSGAGDTVISIATLGLALDLPLAFWSELANLGGGIVCEYAGVIPIESEQLFQEAAAHPLFESFFKP